MTQLPGVCVISHLTNQLWVNVQSCTLNANSDTCQLLNRVIVISKAQLTPPPPILERFSGEYLHISLVIYRTCKFLSNVLVDNFLCEISTENIDRRQDVYTVEIVRQQNEQRVPFLRFLSVNDFEWSTSTSIQGQLVLAVGQSRRDTRIARYATELNETYTCL